MRKDTVTPNKNVCIFKNCNTMQLARLKHFPHQFKIPHFSYGLMQIQIQLWLSFSIGILSATLSVSGQSWYRKEFASTLSCWFKMSWTVTFSIEIFAAARGHVWFNMKVVNIDIFLHNLDSDFYGETISFFSIHRIRFYIILIMFT